MEEKKEKHPGGRPTKYKPELADDMIEFFSREPYREVERSKTDSKGGEYFWYEDTPNDIPFFSDWCRKVGITKDTMNRWKDDPEKPEFSDAYKQSKELQKSFLITNGLRGLYNSTFAIFTAKNITDMRDKQEIDHTTQGDKIKSISIHSFVDGGESDD